MRTSDTSSSLRRQAGFIRRQLEDEGLVERGYLKLSSDLCFACAVCTGVPKQLVLEALFVALASTHRKTAFRAYVQAVRHGEKLLPTYRRLLVEAFNEARMRIEDTL